MFDPTQPTEMRKYKILIVDDEPDLIRLYKFVFQGAGYIVITAAFKEILRRLTTDALIGIRVA